jgi:hypothetical protein
VETTARRLPTPRASMVAQMASTIHLSNGQTVRVAQSPSDVASRLRGAGQDPVSFPVSRESEPERVVYVNPVHVVAFSTDSNDERSGYEQRRLAST